APPRGTHLGGEPPRRRRRLPFHPAARGADVSEKKRTAVVIEDDAQIRRFLKATLEENGFKYVEADTAKKGLIQCETQMPDLIILDLGLPDMDGLEVIERVREWTKVPIVVLSARGQEKDK